MELVLRRAKERNFFCLIDSAYKDLIFNKEDFLDPSFNDLKNAAYAFTFSKKFSMTGFRLGFLISSPLITAGIARFNQITITNVPLFVQDSGSQALKKAKGFASKMRQVYKKRVQTVGSILEKYKIEFVKPAAGFYLFPNIKQDSEKFAYKLLDKKVAVVPGTAFGPYKEFIRISLTESDDRLEKGIKILVQELYKS